MPLPDYGMLENIIRLQATVDDTPFGRNAPLGLEIAVGPDALEFAVRNQDDPDDMKSMLIKLCDVPEWKPYRTMSFTEVRGKSTESVETFLRRAFSQPHSREWTDVAARMGDRIGVRVGNELGITFGDHPHTSESKRLFAEVAHIAMGYANEMKMLHMAAEITANYNYR